MILDFHTHTFPEKIAASAIAKLQGDCHAAAFTAGTVRALRNSMDRAGIDRSVLLPVATNPRQVSAINDLAMQADDPRLIHFGCIHPAMPDWQAELGRIAAAGVLGIKLHPFYHDTDFDDLPYLRLLDRAGELGLTVVTHAGLDIGFPGQVRCTPAMIVNALRQVGPVKLVLAHMGGWRSWDEVEALLPHTDVYLDTAFSLGRITPLHDGYEQPAGLELLDADRFCRMVRLFGAARILFATDSPWADQAQAVADIRALGLSEAEKTAILGGNATRLLGL